MDIKLSKTNIRKQVGGSLLSTVLTLGRTFGPTIAKTIGLSALAGAASEGASQIVKKISGKGVQTGGLIIIIIIIIIITNFSYHKIKSIS